MYLKEEVLKVQDLLKDLQKSLLSSARKHLGIIIPGYTHLQHAQPLLFSHHLMAYFYMSERDKGRMQDLYKRIDVLPLAYNHDMQEDKEPLFDTVSILETSLFLMSKMKETMQVNKEKIEKSTKGDFSTATELADYLVKKGLSFREAHKLVGGMVIYCLENKKNLEDLTLSEMKFFHNNFTEKALEILKPQSAVETKDSFGGTSLKRVKESIVKAKQILKEK
jgi:argininosuccinate lyase